MKEKLLIVTVLGLLVLWLFGEDTVCSSALSKEECIGLTSSTAGDPCTCGWCAEDPPSCRPGNWRYPFRLDCSDKKWFYNHKGCFSLASESSKSYTILSVLLFFWVIPQSLSFVFDKLRPKDKFISVLLTVIWSLPIYMYDFRLENNFFIFFLIIVGPLRVILFALLELSNVLVVDGSLLMIFAVQMTRYSSVSRNAQVVPKLVSISMILSSIFGDAQLYSIIFGNCLLKIPFILKFWRGFVEISGKWCKVSFLSCFGIQIVFWILAHLCVGTQAIYAVDFITFIAVIVMIFLLDVIQKVMTTCDIPFGMNCFEYSMYFFSFAGSILLFVALLNPEGLRFSFFSTISPACASLSGALFIALRGKLYRRQSMNV